MGLETHKPIWIEYRNTQYDILKYYLYIYIYVGKM